MSAVGNVDGDEYLVAVTGTCPPAFRVVAVLVAERAKINRLQRQRLTDNQRNEGPLKLNFDALTKLEKQKKNHTSITNGSRYISATGLVFLIHFVPSRVVPSVGYTRSAVAVDGYKGAALITPGRAAWLCRAAVSITVFTVVKCKCNRRQPQRARCNDLCIYIYIIEGFMEIDFP